MAETSPGGESRHDDRILSLTFKGKDLDRQIFVARSASRESNNSYTAARAASRRAASRASTDQPSRGKEVMARVQSAGNKTETSPTRAWVRPPTATSEFPPDGGQCLPEIIIAENWLEPTARVTSLEPPGSPMAREGDLESIAKMLAALQASHEKRVAKMLERHRQLIDLRFDAIAAIGRKGQSQKSPEQAHEEFVELATESTIIKEDMPLEIDLRNSSASPDKKPRAAIFTVERAGSQAWQDQSLSGQIGSLENMQDEFQKLRPEDTHKGGSRIVQRIVHSFYFEVLSSFWIVASAITVGLELDWEIFAAQFPDNSEADNSTVAFRVINVTLTVAFTVELLLRFASEGCYFCSLRNDNLVWNMFDMCLVLSGLLEELLGILAAGVTGIDISAMRLLRILRLVRSLRIIRFATLSRDLRKMLSGILHSMRSLVWAVMLLIALMYVVAVILLQFSSQEISVKSKDPTSGLLTEAQFAELLMYYGSLTRAIYTLYLSISGGVDWKDAAAPMLALNTALGLLFVAYVTFAVMCVLNIITGVFVENSNKITSADKDFVVMDQIESRRKWFSEVKEVFEFAGALEEGDSLDLEAWTRALENPRIKSCLRKLGLQLESHTPEGLFTILDFDGSGEIDLDEFAQVMASLQGNSGNARAIDLVRVEKEARTTRKYVERILELLSRGRSK
eukprot:TRINITY_DN109802_c0_g1_i1.p1 TRINITY_DN109802_c0_g1~~TRINITY_DN109802_c0_g1_i1.p1  ORF type:complete len:694 (-),score=109.65 TRINITY_DN109802_c0_g1_i1:72-2114(-)